MDSKLSTFISLVHGNRYYLRLLLVGVPTYIMMLACLVGALTLSVEVCNARCAASPMPDCWCWGGAGVFIGFMALIILLVIGPFTYAGYGKPFWKLERLKSCLAKC